MADTNGRSSRSRSRRAAPRSTRSSGRAATTSRGSASTGRAGSSRAGRPAGSGGRKRRFFDYPRTGYTGLHRWLPSWRFVLGAGLAGCFLLVGAFVAAYATVKVPKAGDEISAQTTTVYYAGDEPGEPGPVMGTLPGVNRQIVDYSTLPDYVGKSVAAGEDKTFFTNSGIDVKGMARAFVNNLKGGPKQGGSSLTQEYVERYYVGKTTTSYYGKVKETLLALKIGRTESKDEILGRYLNTIYFGRGAYGIQAASQAYFGVDAKDLTISQAALLAGIVPSPSYWDPAVSPDKAQARWNVILDSMESMGWISAADRAAQQFPTTVAVQNSDRFAGPNGYLLKQVIDELKAPPYAMSEEDIERGGYSIVTTIQKPAQDAAVATANKMWDGTIGKGNQPDPRARLSIVSVDPTDGSIVAEYAGKDFLTDQRSTATYDAIQAGSTFKPFTLVTALEQGIGLDTKFNGRSPQKLAGWDSDANKTVRNFGNEQLGNIDLVRATEESVNTVYAQLNLKVGPANSAKTAALAGITSPVPDFPSNVLGTAPVHPLEMADAYATFAAQGKHSSAFIVRTVLNPNGSVRFSAKPDTKQVFSPDVIADTTYAMTQVVQNPAGTGYKWIKPLDRPIAGKSGTTTDNKAAWFVAYTPHIATAVAMSQLGDDNKAMVTITPFEKGVSQVTGGTTPAHLWADYMAQVFELPQFAEKTPFPDRANVGQDAPTGSATPTPTPTETAPATDETTPVSVAVPSGLTGRLEADASSALYAVGLAPTITSAPSDTVPAGRVISVSPGEGSPANVGDAITLVISTGPKNPPPTPTPTPTSPPPAPTGGAGQGGAAPAGGAGNGSS